jgi:myo-inositol 2-dehydrogenase/D-chiro-inositol 1-dehydrogenase
MSNFGVGLIGCGVMGRSLGKQLLELGHLGRLVGVADLNAEAAARASSELNGASTFGSAEALLAQPGLDAVIIASPGFMHRPLTELAAASGKHVFVEKPMAPTSADCRAMMAATEQAGVLLMVGQVLRYHPFPQEIIRASRSGELGRIYAMEVTRIGGGYGGVWQQDWRNSVAKSGGLLMEVNAHEVDFMRQTCGEVVRVYAEGEIFDNPQIDYPNFTFVSLRFASGAIGLLHTSQVSEIGESSGKVQGSEGAIVYSSAFGEGGELRFRPKGGDVLKQSTRDLSGEVPVRKELRLFLEAMRDGGPSPIPGTEGLANVRVAEAAYESARTHQPVDL